MSYCDCYFSPIDDSVPDIPLQGSRFSYNGSFSSESYKTLLLCRRLCGRTVNYGKIIPQLRLQSTSTCKTYFNRVTSLRILSFLFLSLTGGGPLLKKTRSHRDSPNDCTKEIKRIPVGKLNLYRNYKRHPWIVPLTRLKGTLEISTFTKTRKRKRFLFVLLS